jgi:hypothetical protein
MDFDFNNFVAKSEPSWFTLTRPDNGADCTYNGAPVRIAILGPDTPKMVAEENRIQDKRLKTLARTGRMDLNSIELNDEADERALASIIDWDNFAIGGAPIEYSPATAKELITKHRWLRDFWQEKYSQRGNFLGTVGTSPKK